MLMVLLNEIRIHTHNLDMNPTDTDFSENCLFRVKTKYLFSLLEKYIFPFKADSQFK